MLPWKRLGSQDGAREGTELMAEDADSLELCFLALFDAPNNAPKEIALRLFSCEAFLKALEQS